MMLEYLSLHRDGMDLFNFIYRKSQMTIYESMMGKRDKDMLLTSYPRRFCEEQSYLPASFVICSVTEQPTGVNNVLPF